MTLLRRARGVEERLDGAAQDERVLDHSLAQVDAVNRWLGGERSLLRHLPDVLPADGGSLLDVGTGAAGLPRRLVDRSRRAGRTLRVVATDVHPQMLELARRRCAAYPEIDVRRADATALPFEDGAFDASLITLTLHHLDDDAAVAALREMRRVSRRGVVVSDLERNLPAYAGALGLAATVWSRNPLTRHDGPLSVRRGYTPGELLDLARAAGLPEPRVHRHWAFRLVLVSRLDAAANAEQAA